MKQTFTEDKDKSDDCVNGSGR